MPHYHLLDEAVHTIGRCADVLACAGCTHVLVPCEACYMSSPHHYPPTVSHPCAYCNTMSCRTQVVRFRRTVRCICNNAITLVQQLPFSTCQMSSYTHIYGWISYLTFSAYFQPALLQIILRCCVIADS